MEKQKHTNRLAEICSARGMDQHQFRNFVAPYLGRNPVQLRALVSAWWHGKHRLSWEHEKIVKKLLDLPIDPLYHTPES